MTAPDPVERAFADISPEDITGLPGAALEPACTCPPARTIESDSHRRAVAHSSTCPRLQSGEEVWIKVGDGELVRVGSVHIYNADRLVVVADFFRVWAAATIAELKAAGRWPA